MGPLVAAGQFQKPRTASCEAVMAGSRHLVSVRAAALVQTGRLQVGWHGVPASHKEEGGNSWPGPSKAPPTFLPTDVRLLRVLVGRQRHLRAKELG